MAMQSSTAKMAPEVEKWPRFDGISMQSESLTDHAKAYENQCNKFLQILDEKKPRRVNSDAVRDILDAFSNFARLIDQNNIAKAIDHFQRLLPEFESAILTLQAPAYPTQAGASDDDDTDSAGSLEETDIVPTNQERPNSASKDEDVPAEPARETLITPSEQDLQQPSTRDEEVAEQGSENVRIVPFFSINPKGPEATAFLQEECQSKRFQQMLSTMLQTKAIVSINSRPAGHIEIEFDSYTSLLRAYAREDKLWAAMMEEDNWSQHKRNIRVNIPEHAVVIHGVPRPTFDRLTREEFASKILRENPKLSKPEVIRDVRALAPGKKGDRKSIVIGFTRPENAEIALRHGIMWNGEKKRVVFYEDHRKPCTNCFSARHSEIFCDMPTMCRRCGDMHKTEDCPPTTKPRCRYCKEERESCAIWECSARMEAENEYSRRLANPSRRYLSRDQFNSLTQWKDSKGKQKQGGDNDSPAYPASRRGSTSQAKSLKKEQPIVRHPSIGLQDEKQKVADELELLSRRMSQLRRQADQYAAEGSARPKPKSSRSSSRGSRPEENLISLDLLS